MCCGTGAARDVLGGFMLLLHLDLRCHGFPIYGFSQPQMESIRRKGYRVADVCCIVRPTVRVLAWDVHRSFLVIISSTTQSYNYLHSICTVLGVLSNLEMI